MPEAPLSMNAAYAAVLVVIVFASTVKSALGFGFPLITVPIAANLLGARTAVILIAVPVVFANFLIIIRGGGRLIDLRQHGGLLLGIIAGTVAGAQLLSRLDPGLLSLIVGLSALVFAAFALVNRTPTISLRTQTLAGPGIGLVSGVMGGTTGIFAPLVAAYLHSLRLEKREFVFWLTASFLLGGLVQTVSYYQLGLYTGSTFVYALIACLPVIAGTRLGFWIQDRLAAETFRRLVLVLVLVSGLNLVVRQLLK